MCEFGKLLDHLNKKVAWPICFFTVLNLIYSFSGILYTFKMYRFYHNPIKLISLTIGIILLWLIIALFPYFQVTYLSKIMTFSFKMTIYICIFYFVKAAALSVACRSAQSSGHQVRIRPFLHHNTSLDELNSVLLYSSSMRMSAKLFGISIQGNYLFFIILCLLVLLLTIGMCYNIPVELF